MLFNIWLNKVLIILLLSVCLNDCTSHMWGTFEDQTEGVVRSPGSAVKCNGEQPDMCAGNWTRVLEKSSACAQAVSISPGPDYVRWCLNRRKPTNQGCRVTEQTSKYAKKLVPSEEHTITNTGTVTCLLLMYATTEYLFIRQTNPNLIKS